MFIAIGNRTFNASFGHASSITNNVLYQNQTTTAPKYDEPYQLTSLITSLLPNITYHHSNNTSFNSTYHHANDYLSAANLSNCSITYRNKLCVYNDNYRYYPIIIVICNFLLNQFSLKLELFSTKSICKQIQSEKHHDKLVNRPILINTSKFFHKKSGIPQKWEHYNLVCVTG